MSRALIVIDVQESFRQDPGWETISNPGIVGPVKQLVDAARANGDLVIWVLHAEAGSDTVFDPASGYARVICGIRTEQCCETTARVASDFGFGVTFVTDATATSPIEHWDAQPGRGAGEILADPRTLQVDDILARTEYALAGRFAA